MWSKMVEMELTDEEKIDTVCPIPMPDTPKYPYGLRICLTHAEIEKLQLDVKDIEIGAVIDLRAFACVTSISASDGEYGPNCRVELQIQKLAVENEATEDAPAPRRAARDVLYDGKRGDA